MVVDSEKGQSIIEFLFMIPLVVAMVISLVKVNTAIQASIVNQKYARSHALWLAFNSPMYPELRFREGLGNSFTDLNINQMIIGVAENFAPVGDERGFRPEAPKHKIGKGSGDGRFFGIRTPAAFSARRPVVKILNAVSLCTQSNSISVAGVLRPAYQIENANVDFRFCAYPLLDGGGR